VLEKYDNIVIGAGHNGLICATYLAKSGQSVLLLEASDNIGGLAATCEFHSGYTVSVAHTLSHFSDVIARELDLASHGFRLDGDSLDTIGLNLQGPHVILSNDTVAGVSESDVKNYKSYLESQTFCEDVKALLA
jgi:phytoene dehydrogenase-like protein